MLMATWPLPHQKLVPLNNPVLKSLHPKDALVHQHVEQPLMINSKLIGVLFKDHVESGIFFTDIGTTANTKLNHNQDSA